MKIETMVLGPLKTNCYIAYDEETRNAAVIDPAFYPDRILSKLDELGVKCKYIIFTHAHYDHMLAAQKIIAQTGAKTVCNEKDADALSDIVKCGAGYLPEQLFAPVKADIRVKDGDTLSLDSLNLTFIHTPGHTPGSMCILCDRYMFSGDTLFYRTIGRWDLPLGDYDVLMNTLKTKIMTIKTDYIVLSGHGERTTLFDEKENNEFLLGLSWL